MSDRKLVIFDFDGTLVDSHKHFDQSLVEYTSMHGLAYDHEKISVGWTKPLELDLGFGLSLEQQPQALNDYYRYLNSEIQDKRRFIPDPFDNVAACLETLSQNYDLAIITARNRASMLLSLEHHGLEKYFPKFRTHCCTLERNYKVKPDPDALFCLANETGHALGDIVMIGDTTYDIDMANAAGVKSIAVTWGSHSVEKLAASNPTMIVSAVDELPTAIDHVFTL